MNQKWVTSFELSKELKEAGIEQKSEFYWIVNNYPEPQKYPQLRQEKTSEAGFTHYSAFLTGELGEMLPRKLKLGKRGEVWLIASETQDNGIGWACQYRNIDHVERFIEADTEAEARGKMLLYLKKEGLL